jgi:hypothetical protein
MGGGKVVGLQCPNLGSHGAHECSQLAYRSSKLAKKADVR